MSRYTPRNSYDEDSQPLSGTGTGSHRRSSAGYSPSASSRTYSIPVSSASSADSSTSVLETGVIEKVMGRYGFICCHDRDLRIFFHMSQLVTDESHSTDDFKAGLEVEFKVDKDSRTTKPVAVQIRANPAGQRPAVERLSISERRYEGVVDCPAKPKQVRRTRSLPQNNSRATYEMGRLSYRDNGESFYVQFSLANVADKRFVPQQDDKVSFYIGIEKLTNRQEAFNVTVLEPASSGSEQGTTRGIVRDLRDTFGFIERVETRTRIFFHFSELMGADPQVGDCVEFVVREQQDGRQCACRVSALPDGSVKMEDIESAERVGTIEVGLDSARKGEDSQTGRLKCIINSREEVLEFADREFEGSYTLSPGDRVYFHHCLTRNGQRRAVRVALCELSVDSPRERGIIMTLKEGSHFGFVRCCEREDLRVFFHFNEWLEGKTRPAPGDEVEFEFVESHVQNQRRAIRIKRLETGAVEYIHEEFTHGIIQTAPKLNRSGSKGSVNSLSFNDTREREMEPGVIRIDGSASPNDGMTVSYYERDCSDPRTVPYPGDEVVFRLCENKCTRTRTAVKVSVIRAAEMLTERGAVVALKTNFGFIETADHREQLYFKIKNEEYKMMDEVSFVVSHRGGRTFAEDISILPPGSLNTEVIIDVVLEGVVTKPITDESVESYAGLVEVPSSSLQTLVGTKTESCSTEIQPYLETAISEATMALDAGCPLTVPFTALSLSDIRATPQKGENVVFSLAVRKSDAKTLHTVHLSQKKTLMRGRIDSLKEGFGFISMDESGIVEKESLFFHESEVIDEEEGESATTLEIGDMVEFSVSFNQKRGKAQACNVHRISDQRPDRLSRKVEVSENPGPRLSVRRQPRKPDGTSGFNVAPVERQSGDYVEVVIAQETSTTNGSDEEN